MDGFHEVYERHYPAVYRLALFLTGVPAQAEDLASETFVRAWSARHRIRYATVRAYLLTITRNLYRDQQRAGQTFVELSEQMSDREPPSDVRLEQGSVLREARTRLAHAAPGDRRALLLYAVGELSYIEIASRLGVSLNAVKARIARARDVLRGGDPRVAGKGIKP
jgi:RNA polymerase sigma factor (sigma-70 family)